MNRLSYSLLIRPRDSDVFLLASQRYTDIHTYTYIYVYVYVYIGMFMRALSITVVERLLRVCWLSGAYAMNEKLLAKDQSPIEPPNWHAPAAQRRSVHLSICSANIQIEQSAGKVSWRETKTMRWAKGNTQHKYPVKICIWGVLFYIFWFCFMHLYYLFSILHSLLSIFCVLSLLSCHFPLLPPLLSPLCSILYSLFSPFHHFFSLISALCFSFTIFSTTFTGYSLSHSTHIVAHTLSSNSCHIQWHHNIFTGHLCCLYGFRIAADNVWPPLFQLPLPLPPMLPFSALVKWEVRHFNWSIGDFVAAWPLCL